MALKVAVALLVVAGICSPALPADAGLTGIKGLFRGHAEKNYKILAEHLHKATQSRELADNIKAAKSLLGELPNADGDLIELVNAFGQLKGDETSLEIGCSKDNLANMRLVAEAMLASGNLGINKITAPISRLNRIMVALIAYAISVCPAHLDGKWPEGPYEPKYTDADMKVYVKQLWRIPEDFSFDGYMGKPDKAHHDPNFWASELEQALQIDAARDLREEKKLNYQCNSNPETTTDKSCLARQLQEYVHKPCKEFAAQKEAHDVLEPYGDLLMSWYIIHHAMKEYFSNKEAPRIPVWRDYDNYSGRVREFATIHRACQRLVVMPEKDVVEQVRKYRKHNQ